MSLFNQLKTERIEAMKSKDSIKKDLLGCLISESSKETKEPSDEKVIATIKKFIKNCDDSINMSQREPDIKSYIDKLDTEINILESYLPKQLTKDELYNEIHGKMQHGGGTTVGIIMNHLKTNFNGRYDGKVASDIIKEMFKPI